MSRKIKKLARSVREERREVEAPVLQSPVEHVAVAPFPLPVIPAPAPVAPPPASEWPKIVNVKGASIMLNAPVSPDWEPPMSATVFGSYGSHVSDPSNAPPGMPNRSPNGFPLIYPGLHWNGVEWAGTPIGPVRFHCGESSYETEAQAIAAGRAAAERRNAPPDPRWAQVHDRMKDGWIKPPQGPVDVPLE